jgi:hypothetical protein
LVLALLDGHHALYKVGQRLEERGMLDLLQSGLTRTSLHDYRLGHILDALFAANLNKVLSAIALKALEVYAIPTPGCIRTRRPLCSMGCMQTPPTPHGHRGQPTDIAKMAGTISNRCSSALA